LLPFGDDDTSDCDFFFFKTEWSWLQRQSVLAAEIVAGCGNWCELRKRFPAAETETTPFCLFKNG